ncbi:MAG TPA: pantoate--beta-alanine ligase [Oceanipulchritudo sp.]|nr:pantoate--beta-alanine ligase [Oceanipulchritudo sp.]
MERLDSIEALRAWRRKTGTAQVGFVPTMGALHAGHEALVQRSLRENEQTLVSLFVNPAQFNDPRDCANYPTPLEGDLQICRGMGVSAVFTPRREMLYPDQYTYRVKELEKSTVLEGESRPAHFDGVLTVVLKLLLLCRPDRAYFGEKDWQQLRLVQGLVEAFLLETEVVAVPTVREIDGLALSSRNVRLSAAARILAPEFYRILSTAVDCAMARHELEALGFEVEYVDERDGRRLGAVQLEGVRLIDNVASGEERR